MASVIMVRPPFSSAIRVPERKVAEYEDRGWQVAEDQDSSSKPASKPAKKAAAKKAPAKKAPPKAAADDADE